MLASLAMFASAAILGLLGSVHLLYTFVGTRLHPRDPRLMRRMQQTAVVLTPELSMWGAWVGFNATHSFCAMLFGLLYGYLALLQPAMLFGSPFLLTVAVVLLGALLWIAWRYWFRIPLFGIALAFVCCVVAVIAGATGG